MTKARPIMLNPPNKDVPLGIFISKTATPLELASMFPKSPACLTLEVGPPWFWLYGLKCPPLARQLLEVSPFS